MDATVISPKKVVVMIGIAREDVVLGIVDPEREDLVVVIVTIAMGTTDAVTEVVPEDKIVNMINGVVVRI